MKELWALLLSAFTAFFLVKGGKFENYWGFRDDGLEDVSVYLNSDGSIRICERDQVFKEEYLNKVDGKLYRKNTILKCFCSGDFHRKVGKKKYTTIKHLQIRSHQCGSRRFPVYKSMCKKGEKCGEAIYKRYGYENNERYLDEYIQYCSCPNIRSMPRHKCRKSEITENTEIFRCEHPDCRGQPSSCKKTTTPPRIPVPMDSFYSW